MTTPQVIGITLLAALVAVPLIVASSQSLASFIDSCPPEYDE